MDSNCGKLSSWLKEVIIIVMLISLAAVLIYHLEKECIKADSVRVDNWFCDKD